MASIRTRGLGNGKPAYLVRFRAVDGKERSKQFSRRRDAEHFAHVIEIDRMQGSFVDPRLGKLTVEEWYEQWWPTVTNLRPSTRARNEIAMRTHVLPTFATGPLARVDRMSLREWVAHMADPDEGRLAPATVAKNVQVFNKLMRAAVEDRLISANPLERLPLPRIEREEMRFLAPAELAKLADTIDPRYRSSPPTPASSPSCSANVTTPPPMTRPNERNSSPICSPRSETRNDRQLFLDSRHLHIAGYRVLDLSSKLSKVCDPGRASEHPAHMSSVLIAATVRRLACGCPRIVRQLPHDSLSSLDLVLEVRLVGRQEGVPHLGAAEPPVEDAQEARKSLL